MVDALPNVDYVMSLVLPTDVDNRVADRHQMRAMLTRTRKPIVLVTYEASGCYDAVAMAEAVAGGPAALAARPFLACYVNTATGLLHNADALEKVIFLAERGIPILYIPGSQAGVTGPATQAGAVAYFWAGVLTGLVLAQVVREGAPVMTKGWGGGGLDMRTMVYGYANPDQRATAIALSRWADLPSFSLAGASDAKTVDQQAAAEAALSLAVESLAGPDVVHDLGYLESGLTYSFAQLAICDEIVGWLRHLRAPLRHERRGAGPRPDRRGRPRRPVPRHAGTRCSTSASTTTRACSSARPTRPGARRTAGRSRSARGAAWTRSSTRRPRPSRSPATRSCSRSSPRRRRGRAPARRPRPR